MALISDKYVFFHMPSAGGNFVRMNLGRLLGGEEIGHQHDPPCSIEWPKDRFSFTVLRDPVDWVSSWLSSACRSHETMHKLPGLINFIDLPLSEGFEKSVLALTEQIDRLGYIYRSYTDSIDTFLRTETLTEGLQKLIKDLGMSAEPYHTTVWNSHSPHPEWTTDMRERFAKSEEHLIGWYSKNLPVSELLHV